MGIMTHPKILQLDNSSLPLRWISWKEAVVYHAKNLVSWHRGEVEINLYGGISSKTGLQSIVTTSTIIAVKGDSNKKKRWKVPTLRNEELFMRDHFMCAYCGKVLAESKLTRDHVVPLSQDGPDIWTNVVTACGRCNLKKDNMRPEQAGMKLLYVPYAPSPIEHLILRNRNILADQMEFLLDFLDEKSPVKSHYLKQ
jgi:5-methylcytosine-specific restriction endonuclease McrA